MRIAVISPGEIPVPVSFGGAVETLIDHFADGISKSQHSADILGVKEASAPAVVERSNVTYIRTDMHKPKPLRSVLARKIAFLLFPNRDYKKYLKFVKSKLMENEYDCVIIENRPTFVNAVAKWTKAPIVLHLHNDKFASLKRARRAIEKRCSLIITISEYVKCGVLSVVSKTPVEVVYNGIEISSFAAAKNDVERRQIRQKYGLDPDKFTVCFAGRMLREKGVFELVRAFKLLECENDIQLVIIGASAFSNTEQQNDYTRLVMKECQELGDKVILTGLVDNSEVGLIEGACDVAVLPSIWQEPLSLAVIEAMSSGLAVITTNTGGIPEVCPNDCGILLDVDDNLPQSIANALVALKNDKELREMLSQKAALRAREVFSKENYSKQFIRLIEKL